HLPAPGGIDLLTTLRASLGYPGPPTRTASYPGGLVALFPQEMRRDPASRFLTEVYHYIPVGCAELVAQMSTKRRPRLSSRVPWGASSALAGSAASILAAAFGSSPTRLPPAQQGDEDHAATRDDGDDDESLDEVLEGGASRVLDLPLRPAGAA